MAKISKKNQKVIEPEVSEANDKVTDEKLDQDSLTVKFDNKRLDGLTEEDAVSLVHGAVRSLKSGSIKRITIE